MLHHSPSTAFPKNPSCPLLEYPNKTELLTSPPITECGPTVVAPYTFEASFTLPNSHKAKGPLITEPSIISALLPIYIGPDEAFKVTNSSFAPSSIKIFSGAITFTLLGMGCEILSWVKSSKSSRIAASFLAKISQVC